MSNFPTREELVEDMAVAVAEKMHLIPKGTPWEESSEQLAHAALDALLARLPEVDKSEHDDLSLYYQESKLYQQLLSHRR